MPRYRELPATSDAMCLPKLCQQFAIEGRETRIARFSLIKREIYVKHVLNRAINSTLRHTIHDVCENYI